jgi:AhpC/TSA family
MTVEKGDTMRTSLLLRSIVTAALVGLAWVGVASALEVGQKAPEFTLNGVDGKPVKLSELTAKGPVVIYTFIAAFTPT